MCLEKKNPEITLEKSHLIFVEHISFEVIYRVTQRTPVDL